MESKNDVPGNGSMQQEDNHIQGLSPSFNLNRAAWRIAGWEIKLEYCCRAAACLKNRDAVNVGRQDLSRFAVRRV
jgi:hypothetical protein